MKNSSAVLIIFFSTIFASCSTFFPAREGKFILRSIYNYSDKSNTLIIGQVTDIVSHHPLQRVRVVIEGTSYSSITDTNGNYALEDVPPGFYDVNTRFPLYEEVKYDSLHLQAGNIVVLDFELKSFSIIEHDQ
jgi:Carboxypeptidase regulatory-like domain